MMASSVLLGVEARLAKTDAMLLLTCVAAMGAMARIYLAGQREPETKIGWTQPAILWTALAAGVLLKGPVILMFVGLTAIVLSIVDRSARWVWSTRPGAGILWLILLVSPWFLAIVAKSGGRFFAEALGHDMLSKVTSGQEAHGAPPGFYLLLFWVTFWPGSVLTGLATPAVWTSRREPGARFLLAWMVRGTIGWLLFPAAIAIAVLVVFIIVGRDLGLVVWPFSALAVITGLFAWWLYEVDGAERSLLRGMIASVLIAISVYAITFPLLPSLFPSAMIADEIHATDCKEPRVASTFAYQEPSLVFLLGTDTRFTDGAGAADFLRAGPCHFALIDSRSERSFVQRAETVALRYSLIQRIEGYNISIGKPVSMTVFRSQASP
jgi:4-amino-4-deoxy-L-arabinose transferase-like glycosyltransferase